MLHPGPRTSTQLGSDGCVWTVIWTAIGTGTLAACSRRKSLYLGHLGSSWVIKPLQTGTQHDAPIRNRDISGAWNCNAYQAYHGPIRRAKQKIAGAAESQAATPHRIPSSKTSKIFPQNPESSDYNDYNDLEAAGESPLSGL